MAAELIGNVLHGKTPADFRCVKGLSCNKYMKKHYQKRSWMQEVVPEKDLIIFFALALRQEMILFFKQPFCTFILSKLRYCRFSNGN